MHPLISTAPLEVRGDSEGVVACGDNHVAMVCWVDLRDFDPGGSCTGATDLEDTLLPEDDRPAGPYN